MFRSLSVFKRLVVVVMVVLLSGAMAVSAAETSGKVKYIFLFIGDGTAVAQRYAAELYLAASKGLSHPEGPSLVMSTFPAQGLNMTWDLTSVIPDSSAAGTAIASGHKTTSAALGMDAEGKVSFETIAEVAKKRGWKVGVLSTVSLDHATPAAFYAHVPNRGQMYDISMQLANSGVDYFAGGQIKEVTDKKDESKPNALETAKANGYAVAMGRAEFEALQPGAGKVIAMNSLVDKDGAMYYAIDQAGNQEHVTIAEYVAKGIELLDNPDGFFMMAEAGGKVDWACHANDAASVIHDVIAMDAAVAEAVKFYEKHPAETLIVVTGDHETGGMALGFATTKYSSYLSKLQNQKMSYLEFAKKVSEVKQAGTAKFEDVLPLIHEAFGLYVLSTEEKAALEKAIADGKAEGAADDAKKAGKDAEKTLKYGMVLTDAEVDILQEAFTQSMLSEKHRAQDEEAYLQYGGYDPLTVKLTTILDRKAGIGWATYSHTAAPVQTSALGVGSEMFNGFYDQTDIHKKMMAIAGF